MWALLVTIVILDAGMCPVLQIKSMLLLWECGMEAIIRKFYVLNVKSRQRNRNYCINVQCILQGVLIWNEHCFMTLYKSQLFSKATGQPWILSKTKQINLFLLLCDMFSFVFWKKLKTPKRHFNINWPLGTIPLYRLLSLL